MEITPIMTLRHDGRYRPAVLLMAPLGLLALDAGRRAMAQAVAQVPAAQGTSSHVPARPAGAVSRTGTSAPAAPEAIKVVGTRQSPAAAAQARLATIPGGTSVVDQAVVRKSRVFTDQDVLAFQPGVYAQSSGGGDGLKLSVRGSGLQTGTNYFRQGIYITFDGLPITGPGGTPYELFEPLGLAYTEVLRGANAFDAGSVDLGGAINYVSETGHDALAAQARYEVGSFGYQKEQLSSGQVVGPLDYFISFTNSYRSGYQQQTRATATGVEANVGYQIDPDVSTRFFVRYRQTENQYPGYLTSTQIAQDPTQAEYPYHTAAYGANRIQQGSTWIGNKTTFRFGDGSHLDVGEVYHNYPIDIRSTPYDAVWGYDDFTESLQYIRNDVILGHESDTDIGAFSTTHIHGFQNTTVRLPTGPSGALPFGTLLRRADYQGSDNNLHLGNQTNVWRNLWLVSSLSVLYTRRGANLTIPVQTGPSLYTESLNLAPRGGLRYQLAPHWQLFGNVSRTVEPPNDWEYLSGPVYATGPLKGLNSGAKKLRDETALTWEIGTSGERWDNKWSIDYYHSDLRNELLNVNTTASLATGAVTYGNATPTTHQGVEASLDSTLLKGAWGRFSLRQAYTFSQFNYQHDPVFGNNQIPGVPKHFYQGQLRLDLRNDLYLSFDAQVSSAIPIDYANTDFSRAYHIFGTTIGYDDDGKGREVFLNFQNLTDQHYAAIVSPTLNDHGVPGAFLQPGDGFGVFAGVSFGLR